MKLYSVFIKEEDSTPSTDIEFNHFAAFTKKGLFTKLKKYYDLSEKKFEELIVTGSALTTYICDGKEYSIVLKLDVAKI